jgi:hypothetical protein
MSVVTCLIFAAVLSGLGGLMCLVTLPMARERVGMAHRLLGAGVCLTGGGLIAAAAVFLVMGARGLMA